MDKDGKAKARREVGQKRIGALGKGNSKDRTGKKGRTGVRARGGCGRAWDG